jgi:hypothetical protein
VLDGQLEKMYVDWKDRSVKSLQQIKEQKKKTEDAIKEKIKFEQEALDAERITRQREADLEHQKELQLIENDKYEVEKKAMASRLAAEEANRKKVEAEREAEKAWREVLQQKLINENLRKKKEKDCTIL